MHVLGPQLVGIISNHSVTTLPCLPCPSLNAEAHLETSLFPELNYLIGPVAAAMLMLVTGALATMRCFYIDTVPVTKLQTEDSSGGFLALVNADSISSLKLLAQRLCLEGLYLQRDRTPGNNRSKQSSDCSRFQRAIVESHNLGSHPSRNPCLKKLPRPQRKFGDARDPST